MDQLKNKIEKIASAMKKIEEAASSEINSQDEYLQVCGALLAVTRNMYVEALGPQGAARMFQDCLLYTSPSPRDATLSRMPSSA